MKKMKNKLKKNKKNLKFKNKNHLDHYNIYIEIILIKKQDLNQLILQKIKKKIQVLMYYRNIKIQNN